MERVPSRTDPCVHESGPAGRHRRRGRGRESARRRVLRKVREHRVVPFLLVLLVLVVAFVLWRVLRDYNTFTPWYDSPSAIPPE